MNQLLVLCLINFQDQNGPILLWLLHKGTMESHLIHNPHTLQPTGRVSASIDWHFFLSHPMFFCFSLLTNHNAFFTVVCFSSLEK